LQLLKIIRQNPTLSAAIAISVLLHGVALAVRIVAPDAFKYQPTDPGLEVILVNAKHDKKPIKAEALAQANLDGGGNADDGRAKSPLPDMHRSEDGDNLKDAQRRIAQLEEDQEKMLAQAVNKSDFTMPPITDRDKPTELVRPDAVDKLENAKAMTRQVAEISKNIEDYNKRPRKTQITPSTKRVEYAMYYKQMQTQIEKVGTLNFPEKDGQKLYGELLVYIPIFQDGSIYEKEGGPRVEHSSGSKALDNAALRIVRRAAPFGRFKANMRSTDKDDVWEVITHFKFTREAELETELRGRE
jgi:protein TonB